MAKQGSKFDGPRKELKNALYIVLKNHPDPKGIPKNKIWNEITEKLKVRVAAQRFGLTKMKNGFDLFEDMLIEKSYRYRTVFVMCHFFTNCGTVF